MSFWIIFSLFVVAGGILVIGKVANGKRRRNHLIEAGRTSTLETVKSQAHKISRIIQTDFGYGREVWALHVTSAEIDRKLRAFQAGVLILPRPKVSDLQEFCQSRHIALELMMIK
jgi:hypothetical protein